MRPKQPEKTRHDDLFRARFDQIINMKHALVVLANKIDWRWLDAQLANSFSDTGRPGEPVRFMVRPPSRQWFERKAEPCSC